MGGWRMVDGLMWGGKYRVDAEAMFCEAAKWVIS